MRIVLISTYELGRQPFGLASPAGWLRARGASLVAFYVPMHTATRLAVELLPAVHRINPAAHICFYGLYAPMNESWLRRLGVQTILGGEFEEGLLHLASRIADSCGAEKQSEPVISLARQKFLVPDRSGLISLEEY